MGNPKKILFVCGGNTCRSPMAKVILEQMLKKQGLNEEFNVDSAAYKQPDDTSAHPNARQVIVELYGADLLAYHTPKKITEAIRNEADIVIVMEDYMKAGLPSSNTIVLGIADPYGPDIEKYRTCAVKIQRNLQNNWANIIGKSTLSHNTMPQPPTTSSKKTLAELMEKYGVKRLGVDRWVHNEVLKIAKSVNYGRGEHSTTVTRLMLNMYDDLVAIGLIIDGHDKRSLADIIGLSHDIGVGKEQSGEGHDKAGWRILKEQLWENNVLTDDSKNTLSIIMYGVFYHRTKIPGGKIKPLNDIPLEDYRSAAELVSLIRLADGLDHGPAMGSLDMIEKVEMVRTSKGVECRVFPRPGKTANVEGLVAKSYSKREVFEATFGKLTFWLPGDGHSWVPWKS